MYKEVVKLTCLGLICSTFLFSGCASKESKAADGLLERASKAIDEGNSTLAISILDSLQYNYPSEVDKQREGMKLRPKAIEISLLAEIQTTDSMIAVYADIHKTLGEKMKTISGPDLVEPYQTPIQGYNPNFINTTGLQARIDRAGQFYVVSSVNPGGVNHISLNFKSGGDELISESVLYDGELNYRLNGSEVITFMPSKCEVIGAFMQAHRTTPVTVTFVGEKGKTRQIKLSQAQVEGMADAYLYSEAAIRGRDLTVELQKLERQLQVARDQMARLN